MSPACITFECINVVLIRVGSSVCYSFLVRSIIKCLHIRFFVFIRCSRVFWLLTCTTQSLSVDLCIRRMCALFFEFPIFCFMTYCRQSILRLHKFTRQSKRYKSCISIAFRERKPLKSLKLPATTIIIITTPTIDKITLKAKKTQLNTEKNYAPIQIVVRKNPSTFVSSSVESLALRQRFRMRHMNVVNNFLNWIIDEVKLDWKNVFWMLMILVENQEKLAV